MLDAGVDVNIRSGRIDWPRFLTPLEKTLLQDRLPYEELLKDLPAPLEHGAEITDQCREFLHKSEEHFQHVKRGITDLHFQRSQAEKPGLPLGKGRPRLCCTGPLS